VYDRFVGNRTLQVRSVRSINVNNNDPKLISGYSCYTFRSTIVNEVTECIIIIIFYFLELHVVLINNSCRHEENENINNAIWIFFGMMFLSLPLI
jgi:hypothetical protein